MSFRTVWEGKLNKSVEVLIWIAKLSRLGEGIILMQDAWRVQSMSSQVGWVGPRIGKFTAE